MRLRYQGKHAARRVRRSLMALPAVGALAMTPILIHPGDTMSGIAAQHGVSLGSLEAANPQIANPNLIYAGQSLNLPTGPGQGTPAIHQSAAQSAVAAAPAVGSTAIPAWATCIVQRESGGNPTIVNQITGDGGGLFGDLTSTWANYDGYHEAYQAPVSVQIAFNDALSGNGSNLKPWAADHCPGT